MKKTKLIVSIIIIIWWMIPFISFWDFCPTCWTTPKEITLANEFITEILWHIKTIWTTSPYAGKYVPPSWFDSGIFTPPKQWFMSKTLRRSRETLWSALAIARVHLEFDDLANLWDSLAVIARNKTIIRDRQKISKIEQNINKKKYELSVWWWRTDKIWWVTLDKIENTITEYKKLWILDNWTEISNLSEYWDLVLVLWKMSSSLKHLVALWGDNRAKKDKKVLFQARTRWKTLIKINHDAINNIQSAYSCTKLYACEESRWNIKEELNKIKDSFKNWLWNAKSEFDNANKRLLEAYSQNNLKKIREEQAIFGQLSWAWYDFKDFRTRSINEIKTSAVWEQFEEFGSGNKSDWSNDWNINWIQTKTTKIVQREKNKKALSDTIKIVEETHTEEKTNPIETIIKNRIQKTTEEKIIIKKKYWMLDTPVDILMGFVFLSEKINHITKNIVWNKDNPNCLISNLENLAEKQCSL